MVREATPRWNIDGKVENFQSRSERVRSSWTASPTHPEVTLGLAAWDSRRILLKKLNFQWKTLKNSRKSQSVRQSTRMVVPRLHSIPHPQPVGISQGKM